MKIFKVTIFTVLFIISNVFAVEQRYDLPVDNSPYIGAENAPVTIIEFIDYQ